MNSVLRVVYEGDFQVVVFEREYKSARIDIDFEGFDSCLHLLFLCNEVK